MNCSDTHGPQTLTHGSVLGEASVSAGLEKSPHACEHTASASVFTDQVHLLCPFVLCSLSLFVDRWALIPEVKASGFVNLF